MLPAFSKLYIVKVFLFLCCLCLSFVVCAQKESIISGIVSDEKGKPLEFAAVKIEETGNFENTSNSGEFSFPLNIEKFDSLTLTISFTGRQTVIAVLYKKDFDIHQRIILKQQSLTLKDVQVQAVRENLHSTSSIVFDREAIMQSQAFSLADILNKLPGKLTQAPNLQEPQTLTLRTNAPADGLNGMNNSFGIAIYIDGVRMNNDANMQARSLSIRGINGANISSYRDGSFDVAYNGFDLRDIPVENIERIEVIQGVADAKYGEMSNGAILITTRAGRTPTSIAVNVNGGSTQITGSKGFQLKGKGGAINISAGYTNSNKDPTDKVKSYSRVNTSAKWTVDISKRVKNTFSFGYDRRLDNVKTDPDDDAQRKTYERGNTINIANRTSLSIRNGFIRNIDMNWGFSRGKQDTYSQQIINSTPIGIADKDTTGVYEGYYIPGNYLAMQRIIGIPVSINGTLDISSKTFFIGNVSHHLSMGFSLASSGNKGPGTIVDPDRPRWIGSSLIFRSERPVDLEKKLPFLSNEAFYIQDNISGKAFGKKYTASLGFRSDIQNGFVSYVPRIGINYALNKNWGVNLSYGTSTKAPALAARYPVPSWLDIPLLQLYNGNTDQSLFLVYTKKIIPDNSYLKAARNTSVELGLTFNNKWSNGSLNVYAKRNTNGFNSNNTPTPIYIPVYDYTIDVNHKINYFPTGQQSLYIDKRNTATNGLYTADYGAELMYATKEFPSIATGFSIRSAYTYSVYDDRNDTTYLAVSQNLVDAGKPAIYGVYKPEKNKAYSLNTTLSSITHIPKLGFTVTVSADIVMMQYTHYNPRSTNPLGYIDRNMEYVSLSENEINNPEYDYLRVDPTSKATTVQTHFMYPCLNVTIAKEIKKKIRLMITGYNMFNIRPKYIDPVTKTVTIYNQETSLSAGITFQL